MITGPSRAIAETSETRCECGQLIAKVRGQSLELKCKRCKRIVVIPFSSIQGWRNRSIIKSAMRKEAFGDIV